MRHLKLLLLLLFLLCIPAIVHGAACLSDIYIVEADPIFAAWDKDYADLTNKPALGSAAAAATTDFAPASLAGTLTNTKWCTTDGTAINCTSDAPTSGGSVTNLCKTIPNPNDADAWLFHTNQKGSAWTVNEIRGVALGGTSVVFTMQECDANGANCAAIENAQTVTTGTASTGTITDSSIADNAVLKLDIGTVTGAVTQLMVCVEVE